MREAAVRGLLSLFTECGDYVTSRVPLTSFCLVMILLPDVRRQRPVSVQLQAIRKHRGQFQPKQ